MQGLHPAAASQGPQARRFGLINGLGVRTLMRRELDRDLRLWTYTIVAPVGQTFLFALLFTLVKPAGVPMAMGGLPFMEFLIPGLIASAMMLRAFQSASMSLVMDKLEGIITDLLVAPLTPGEMLGAYVAASAVSGLVVAAVVWTALLPFTVVVSAAPAALVCFIVLGTVLAALLGRIAGIVCYKWDHLAAFETFIVMPLLFLSGTFFSLDRLPPAWRPILEVNPLFYVIDGMRYGMTGRADAAPLVGAAALAGLIVVAWGMCHAMIRRAYRLKA